MSEYKNFTVDFPKRLLELNKQFYPIGKKCDLEVSYLIMLAASGFLLSFERLSKKSSASFFDLQKDFDLSAHFDLDELFVNSKFCKNRDKWQGHKIEDLSGQPDDWVRKAKPLMKTVGGTLKHLRNSLAHSNIFTDGSKHINKLIFISEKKNNLNEIRGYNVTITTVADFKTFIEVWLSEISKMPITSKQLWELIEKAA